MVTQHSAGIIRADLYSVNDLASHLGISRWTVYRLVRSGEIRAVKVGERIRFRPADVEAYLEREPAP